MKVFLTGANGFVGRRIAQAAEDCFCAPSLRGANEDDLKRLIEQAEPDLIVHTAAISDIAVCEKDGEASYRANVILPLMLAKAGKGIKTLMFSSDQVYTGNRSDKPFKEDEPLSPANTYAQHKLEMEERVLDIAPESVMLRATWMYDLPIYSGDKTGNFFMNILRAGLRGETVSFSGTEFRGLTYAREVAELTLKAKALPGGAYNFGSPTRASMYDTALALQKMLGIRPQVVDQPKNRDLWMDPDKMVQNGLAFSDTIEGLRQCARDYGLLKAK